MMYSKKSALVVFSVLMVASLLIWRASVENSPAALVAKANEFLKSGEYENAFKYANAALKSNPDSPDVLKTFIDAAQRTNQLDSALNACEQLTKQTGQRLSGHRMAAQIALQLADLESAETHLRQFLELSSDHVATRRELVTLLLTQGRHTEAQSEIFRLLLQGDFLLDELVMLGSSEEFLEDEPLLNRALKRDPDSGAALLGLGSLKAFTGDNDDANDYLTRAVEVLPQDDESWAELGSVYLAMEDLSQLEQWRESLPDAALSNAVTQYILGRMSENMGEMRTAAEHYAKALTQNPNHRSASSRLGNLLNQSGKSIQAEVLLRRSSQLDELERTLHRVLLNEYDWELMSRAAELTELLGRPTEAWAWWLAIAKYHPEKSPVALPQAQRLQQSALSAKTQNDEFDVTAIRIDFDSLKLNSNERTMRHSSSEVAGKISFRHVSEKVGLTKSYYGGFDGEPRGLWLYEGFGGGAGVLDYDCDGHPEFYFVHGNQWPPDFDDPRSCNLLYRSLATRMIDVTEHAGIRDCGFGQGVSIGDFDADGFADIYVANIGTNQLFRNNGDGTFENVSPDLMVDLKEWTTSCLMADVNGDGHDDLYDVNYMSGDEPFSHKCYSGEERLFRSCKPDLFEGAIDRLWINQKDGTFLDATKQAGIHALAGKGLGLVAADFDESGTIDLFVANDSTVNSFFVNNGNGDRSIPTFEESGLLAGLALNGSGKVEACMGIAVGDVVGSQHLDLFVTNFYQETNTLYSSDNGKSFVDKTDFCGLGHNTFAHLSFGTQFIDADLDGNEDLVVVSGHVDDYSHMDIPWKMTPQFYRNSGTGQFEQIGAADLGEYFQHPQLGRALARTDWNRDGRDDFIVTHLDQPPALLENQTADAGNSISFKLTGTISNRSGVGAILEVHAGNKVQFLQQTAGDGYYCTNERKLTVGLGQGTVVHQLRVRWPSGMVSDFADLSAGNVWLVVEGASEPLAISYEQ